MSHLQQQQLSNNPPQGSLFAALDKPDASVSRNRLFGSPAPTPLGVTNAGASSSSPFGSALGSELFAKPRLSNPTGGLFASLKASPSASAAPFDEAGALAALKAALAETENDGLVKSLVGEFHFLYFHCLIS